MKTSTLALLLIVSPLSVAAKSDAERGIVGAGAISCGEYVDVSSDSSTAPIVVSWAQGFLSGINLTFSSATGKPMIDLPDHQSIKLYLENHCKSNPLETPQNAAVALFGELRSR